MQTRDLVEAHRLVFSAKLYDHQGPIARGGGSYQPPPLTVRVMRNALTGRGLSELQIEVTCEVKVRSKLHVLVLFGSRVTYVSDGRYLALLS